MGLRAESRSWGIGVFLVLALFLIPALATAKGPAPPESGEAEVEAPTPEGETVSPLESPLNFTAVDNPNDDGEKIKLTWELSPGDQPELGKKENPVKGYRISRLGPEEAEWQLVTVQPPGIAYFLDEGTEEFPLENDVLYDYKIEVVGEGEILSPPIVQKGIVSSSQFFNTDRINILVCVIAYLCILLFYIFRARKGHELFVRRIAGLDAVDEAIGRATEMGRPILFITGLHDVADISTIAAITILGKVARKTAEYETPLLVPNYDPMVMLVAQETVKQAYLEGGHPDAYSDDMVFFLTTSQFGFVAAVDGIMVREKPATNFYMGYYYAESLILAETGAATGAIQIAGTDSVTQLPFFITACDYTIIGEELYAASAYLSKEPLQLGSLKAQDFAKVIIGALMLTGIAATLFGWMWVVDMFIAR